MALPSSLPARLLLPLFLLACCATLATGLGQSTTMSENISDSQRAMIGRGTNLSLFASRYEKFTPAKLQEWVGDAGTVAVLEGTEADWQGIAITWSDLTVTMNTKSIHSEGMVGYLGQFQGFAYNQLAGGEMDSQVYAVIRQIGRTSHMYSMSAEKPLHAECIALARAIADSEKAIVFESNQVFDNELRQLLGPDGSRDEEAKIPVFPSAIERRERSLELLTARELKPIPLPETIGDEAVRLREVDAAARRFLCVAAVAMKGDQKDQFDADGFIAKNDLGDWLTSDERSFLESPTDEASSIMTWRYEAAWALLWALQQTDELGFPDAQANADRVIEAATKGTPSTLASKGIRPKKELLDQVDVYYLCNWITTDARTKNVPAKGLDGSVVYERLYALNWLVFDKNADWDDVRNDS